MVSTNMKEVNENGYCFNGANINLDGRESQHINAILITQPGKLPWLSLTLNWKRMIIIDLPHPGALVPN